MINLSIILPLSAIPSFVESPKSVNGTVGESVTFKCVPDAKPSAKIEWYTNAELIDRKFTNVFLVDLVKI